VQHQASDQDEYIDSSAHCRSCRAAHLLQHRSKNCQRLPSPCPSSRRAQQRNGETQVETKAWSGRTPGLYESARDLAPLSAPLSAFECAVSDSSGPLLLTCTHFLRLRMEMCKHKTPHADSGELDEIISCAPKKHAEFVRSHPSRNVNFISLNIAPKATCHCMGLARLMAVNHTLCAVVLGNVHTQDASCAFRPTSTCSFCCSLQKTKFLFEPSTCSENTWMEPSFSWPMIRKQLSVNGRVTNVCQARCQSEIHTESLAWPA